MTKKIMCLFISVLFSLSLTACNSNEEPEVSVSRITEDELTQEGVVGYSEFENQIKEVVDFSNYELLGEGKYLLNKDNNITFDNVINIKDIPLDLNNSFINDIKDLGFDFADNTVLNVPANSSSDLFYMESTDGDIASNIAFVVNNSSDNMVMLDECPVTMFQYGEEGLYNGKLDDFSFTNGITNKSNWKDVINKFGEPNNIYYHIFDLGNGKAYDTVYLKYNLQGENNELTIEYSPSLEKFEFISFDIAN